MTSDPKARLRAAIGRLPLDDAMAELFEKGVENMSPDNAVIAAGHIEACIRHFPRVLRLIEKARDRWLKRRRRP
ncbi:hypothetical protein AMJ57_00805 [Parcubacteria bacterium SG8_24]|nr:MAG: hypothetical protein AMJ57_00805 [Parcubacteria bacterium SG8_24]